MIYAGGGVRWFANEIFNVRGDAQVQAISGDEDDETNFILAVGVGFVVGGQ